MDANFELYCEDRAFLDQLRNIIFSSNGDLRKGINLLQNMSLSDNFSAVGLQVVTVAHIVDYVKTHNVLDSYNEICKVRLIENFSISDFLNKLLYYLLENYITHPNLNKCIQKLAVIERNVLIGSIEKIHICAIISVLKAISH